MADLFDVVVARKLSGGGGGGSAEPLVCTYNSSTGYLDKTYGEIKTAALSGKSVYLKDEVGETEGVYRLQNLLSYQTQEYEGDAPTFSGTVTFSGGSLITSVASSVSALDAEYPFYGD